MRPIPILRQVPHEPAGTLENALRDAGVPFHYVDMFGDARPTLDLDQVSGLIVLGGPMNVDETDRYPFLADEVVWIREAVRRELPLLGVCLGSQLLAKALGAAVYANRIKEIGWYEIELTPAAAGDPLLGGLPSRPTVFQWHGDTFDLPDGAVHLAGSELCRQQAFRYGESAWGLQFHFEMTAAMVDDWLGEPGNCGELSSLDYVDPERIRAETPQKLPGLQAIARQVLSRFAAMCRG